MPSPDQRVPELIGGLDIRALPLTALDGFVLSRIDGRSSTSDIIAMTGLASDQVESILAKLAELGAIRWPAPVSTPPLSAHRPPPFSTRVPDVSPRPPPDWPGTPARNAVPPGAAPTPLPPGPTPLPPRRTLPPPGRTPLPPRSGSSTSVPPTASTPPRRRPSYGSTPRRLFSESSISGPPPPDMRTFSQRPRAPTPARLRTPVPSGAPPRESEPSPWSSPPPVGEALDAGAGSSSPPREGSPATRHGASLPPGASPSFDSDEPTSQRSLRELMSPRDPERQSTEPSAANRSLSARRDALPSEQSLLYDVRELEEEVDLAPERRKQILDTFYRLPVLNYYGLLGVREVADKKDIRAAYFALSKQFHPDSMFRKELGSFKAKMTSVFQALTEAYETLSKKKAREEYDRYLRSTRSAADAERALATDEVVSAEGQVEVPKAPALPSTDYIIPAPTPVPVAPREVSADARRIARELLERRLRGAAARPTPDTARPAATVLPSKLSSLPVTPALPAGPSSLPIDRQQLARQLGRTLIDVSKFTGSGDKVSRAVNGARAAFERGDIAASVQHMARAFSLAPERPDLHAEYDKLSRMLAQKLADDYQEQAKFEVKQAKWANAAVSWAKVCEGRPDDAAAHRSAAFSLLKAGGDLRGAQKYAQQAVYLAPDDIEGRILLAQTYLTVGLKLNARRELDAAAKLDPSNEMVKNLLSDLNR